MTRLRKIDSAAASPLDFDSLLEAVVELLRRHGRVSYRGLKRRFELDDAYLEDLKAELILGRLVARDEDGRVLCWSGPESPPLAAAERLPAESMSDTAERRQLTIMFCDLVSSTELSSQIDPEEYRELLQRYHVACSSAVARYGGHIAQYLGDGLQVYFGYPIAQEDSAARAVHAALEIVLQLTASREAGAASLPVRIGIHSGVVVVGDIGIAGQHRERLALGETPNVAARVQALAEPDTIVITAATRTLLRERFVLDSLGEHVLRGLKHPMALFRPVSVELPTAPPGLGLCGRAADLALLRARLDAARGGTGQLVTVSGEPGIGKSCLIRAFRAQLHDVQQWECRCSPYHTGTALHPLAEMLRRKFGIDASDGPEFGIGKLRAGLEARAERDRLNPRPEELLQPFAALLSLESVPGSPRAQRLRTLALLTSFLLARADREPVLLIIEDLHWADPSTLEFLSTFAIQARATHTMILISHRPGFDVGSGDHELRTTVTLERLAAGEAKELLQRVCGDKKLPASVVEELLEKADGMPLFLEELTRMLIGSQFLAERAGRYELLHPLSRAGIPSTIQDSLMARLDQLGRAREVAQIGAVLGRSFRYELLRAVWQRGEEPLRTYLAEAVKSGLLLQRGFPPEATYSFKHALVQETAYDTMLRRERRSLHERAANALLSVLPQLAAAQPELVAHHFTQAQLFDPASRHWQRAADKALETAANVEAVRHLCKALDSLQQLPPTRERDQREVSLIMQLCPPLIATQGYACPELAAACQRAHALCAQVSRPRERWPVLWGLWYHSETGGAFELADQLARELEQLAAECGDDEFELQLCGVRSHAFWRGQLQEARVHCERALALYDEQRHGQDVLRFGQDSYVLALSYLNCIEVLQGAPARGQELGERAIAHARKLGHAYSLALALGFAAAAAQLSGNRVLLRRYSDEQIALCHDHGFSLWLADGQILRAWADALDGDPHGGLAALQQGLKVWQASGARIWHTHQLVLLGEIHMELRQIDEGLRVLDSARSLIRQGGECVLASELLRLRSEFELMKQPPDIESARSSLRKAITLAREQGATLLEQRAQRSARRLARLDTAATALDISAPSSEVSAPSNNLTRNSEAN